MSTERIAELGHKLEITRQQYMDADHGSRIWHAQCKGLRSANGRLSKEIATLRSEASELMAENSDKALLIADLRQRLDWHTTNAERQASVIREQGAEIERLKWRAPRGAEFRWEPNQCQADLPPTRAETDAMGSLANTLAGIDNEERD